MPFIVYNYTESPRINNAYIPVNNNRYSMNDLGSVYTHYSEELGINIPTENKLKGDNNNGKSNE